MCYRMTTLLPHFIQIHTSHGVDNSVDKTEQEQGWFQAFAVSASQILYLTTSSYV